MHGGRSSTLFRSARDPAEAEDRAIPGHWEGDLLAGGKNSYIATLVERHSRFLLLIKVRNKDSGVVVAALSKHVRKLPATLRRSLTWDRGLEMVMVVGIGLLGYFFFAKAKQCKDKSGSSGGVKHVATASCPKA